MTIILVENHDSQDVVRCVVYEKDEEGRLIFRERIGDYGPCVCLDEVLEVYPNSDVYYFSTFNSAGFEPQR